MKFKKHPIIILLLLSIILLNQMVEIKGLNDSEGVGAGEEVEECTDNIGCGRNANRLLSSFLALFFFSMLVVYGIVRLNLHYIPESLSVVVYGVIIGIIIKYANISTLNHLSTYNPNDFFLFILPFIIYETGFSLKKYDFFKNIKATLILATMGTMIAFLGTGFGLYWLGKIGMSADLTIFESLLVSSISAATDPVATLGIFKALDVEPALYMIVLGESILNDAVSVILYDAVLSYSVSEIWKPILLFFGVFTGSILLGILFALILALLLKYIDFGSFPVLETIFILIFSYSSYLIAESVYLSGILSTFFCGITSSQYVYKSLSNETKQSVSQLYRMTAFIGETIVFIYIGLVLPNFNFNFNLKLVISTFILLLITRAISIFPTFFLLNKFNDGNKDKITLAIQIVIWVSGLRGAISFSLMEQSEIDSVLSLETTSLLKTDILLVVYLTLFIFGSLTYPLLKVLKIRMNSSDQTLESINKPLDFQHSRFHFIGSHFIKFDNKLNHFFSRDAPPVKSVHIDDQSNGDDDDIEINNNGSGDSDDYEGVQLDVYIQDQDTNNNEDYENIILNRSPSQPNLSNSDTSPLVFSPKNSSHPNLSSQQ